MGIDFQSQLHNGPRPIYLSTIIHHWPRLLPLCDGRSSGKTKDLSTKALSSLNGIGEGDLKGDFRVVYYVSRRHAEAQ